MFEFWNMHVPIFEHHVQVLCDETEPEQPLRAPLSCVEHSDMDLEQTSFINGNKKPFVPENPLLFILMHVP
jgi:hypothetical protein